MNILGNPEMFQPIIQLRNKNLFLVDGDEVFPLDPKLNPAFYDGEIVDLSFPKRSKENYRCPKKFKETVLEVVEDFFGEDVTLFFYAYQDYSFSFEIFAIIHSQVFNAFGRSFHPLVLFSLTVRDLPKVRIGLADIESKFFSFPLVDTGLKGGIDLKKYQNGPNPFTVSLYRVLMRIFKNNWHLVDKSVKNFQDQAKIPFGSAARIIEFWNEIESIKRIKHIYAYRTESNFIDILDSYGVKPVYAVGDLYFIFSYCVHCSYFNDFNFRRNTSLTININFLQILLDNATT